MIAPFPSADAYDLLGSPESSPIDILLEVSDSVSSAVTVDAALNRLAWIALRATGADRCAILLHDPADPTRLLPAAGASRTGDLAALWARFRAMEPVNLHELGLRSILWSANAATVIEDVASSALVPESWKNAWDSKSIGLAILRANGEAFGVLAVDYVEQHHLFTASEAKLLEAIAKAAGVALRSAKLVERLQHAVRVERRLSECTVALRSGRSLPEMLDLVADRFVSLLPGVSCSIHLLSADLESFRLVAFRGIAPRRTEARLDGLPRKEVESLRRLWSQTPRKPVIVSDIRGSAGWDVVIPPEIGTGMLLPLGEEGDIIGFVAVGRSTGTFTDEEVRVAKSFSDQAALAIEQARLTRTLEMRVKLIEALYRLGDVIVRTSTLKPVLRDLNREIGADLGIQLLRISLRDRELAEALRVSRPTDEDLQLLKEWGRSKPWLPVKRGERLALPILGRRHAAGVLWFAGSIDTTALELVHAVAGAIGEVVYKAKLRRTAERRSQELAVAADRERIARDLHDTVGQTLYGIGLQLQDVLCDVDDPVVRLRLEPLRALAAQSVSDVRSAVYALSFLHVRADGFVPSLRALARQFTRAAGVNADLRIRGEMPRLRDECQSALYRVAHEALVNVERHARATGVVIQLSSDEARVTLTIRDDGVGLNQRQVADWRSSGHFGMRMMVKSIEEVGGALHIREGRPRGLLIEASMPLRRKEAISS